MSNEENVKRMADLLRAGATMLSYNCPVCSSPLFRIKGEVWCPNCNKRVIIASQGGQAQMTSQPLLAETEKIILQKIQETIQRIAQEQDQEKLERLSSLLSQWFDTLEKARHMLKT